MAVTDPTAPRDTYHFEHTTDVQPGFDALAATARLLTEPDKPHWSGGLSEDTRTQATDAIFAEPDPFQPPTRGPDAIHLTLWLDFAAD